MTAQRDTVIFDAMETLGMEIAASRTDRFVEFRPFGSARRALAGIEGIARAGVLSLDPAIPEDRLRQWIVTADLTPALEPELIATSERGEADPFGAYLSRTNLLPETLVFVSHDAKNRALAEKSGLAACPHLRLLRPVLEGRSLHLVKLTGGSQQQQMAAIDATPTVPVLWTNEQETPDARRPVVYALTDDRMPDALGASGTGTFTVEVLGPPDMVIDTTLILLQVTRAQAAGFPRVVAFLDGLERDGALPLFEEVAGGFLVAWPADRSPTELHPPAPAGAHGHARVLRPSAVRPSSEPVDVAFPRRAPTPDEEEIFAAMSFAPFEVTTRKWAGGAQGGGGDGNGSSS